MNKRLS